MTEKVRKKFEFALEKIKLQGHSIEMFDFPLFEACFTTYSILTSVEASSCLARYGNIPIDSFSYGQLYKHSCSSPTLSSYKTFRKDLLGSVVNERINQGHEILTNHQDVYLEAVKLRQTIGEKLEDSFSSYDCILTPTSPEIAPRLEDLHGINPTKITSKNYTDIKDLFVDLNASGIHDTMTVFANLAGIPAITIPIGRESGDSTSNKKNDGSQKHMEIDWPVGLQILCSKGHDFLALEIGKRLSQSFL